MSTQAIENIKNGSIVYYYTDESANISTLIATNLKDSQIAPISKYKFKKAHFKSYLKIDEPGIYQLLTNESNTQFSINGQTLTGSISLNSNQVYALDVIINKIPTLKNSQIFWIKPNSNIKKPIPLTNLLLPLEGIFKNTNKNKVISKNLKIDEIKDEDSDLIPDDWEINGYTVDETLHIVKWNENEHKPIGLIKYLSNYKKWSTTNDPYSDYQKVLGSELLDPNIALEARNPIVAAYPVISVDLEQMLISDSQSISFVNSYDLYKTTAAKVLPADLENYLKEIISEMPNYVDWDGEFESLIINKLPLTFVNSNNNSYSTKLANFDYTDSFAGARPPSLPIEEPFVYLSPILRYSNLGTAPAYTVYINYFLKNYNWYGDETMLTEITPSSTPIAVLNPNTTYPSLLSDGITVSSDDNSNLHRTKINQLQLISLIMKPTINISNLQFNSNYAHYSNNQLLLNSWAPYLSAIKAATAVIELITPDGKKIERRVAARKPFIPGKPIFSEAVNPEITLKQALKLTYGLERTKAGFENDKVFYQKIGFIVVGEEARNEIYNQFDLMEFDDIANIKLRPQMKIIIYPIGKVLNKITKEEDIYINGKSFRHSVRSAHKLSAWDRYPFRIRRNFLYFKPLPASVFAEITHYKVYSNDSEFNGRTIVKTKYAPETDGRIAINFEQYSGYGLEPGARVKIWAVNNNTGNEILVLDSTVPYYNQYNALDLLE